MIEIKTGAKARPVMKEERNTQKYRLLITLVIAGMQPLDHRTLCKGSQARTHEKCRILVAELKVTMRRVENFMDPEV
jgi:hypothetical protein